MKIFLKYIVVVILGLIGVDAQSALSDKVFDVRYLGREEGLSNERVFSIVEDKNKVIWLATKAGVDRYNGYRVKSYTLPGNFYYGDMAGRKINLFYAADSVLWACDNVGRIYSYSEESDSFEFQLSLGDVIQGEITLNKMYLDDEGTLWFGLKNGLYKKAKDEAVQLIASGLCVNDIVCSGDSLFVGASSGAYLLPDISMGKKLLRLNADKNVQTLFYDKRTFQLWLGTFNSGLWRMDLRTSEFLPIKYQHSVFLNPIRAITCYDAHTLLVGIDGGGVYTVDPDSGDICLFINTEDSRDNFLRGNGVYSVFKDYQGNIWIGSYTGGVSIAVLQEYPVTFFTHKRGKGESLINDNVNDVEENINNDLWFATDCGISIRHASTQKWKHVLDAVVVTLCKADHGRMWAGTYGDGIYLLDATGTVIHHYTEQQGVLTTNYIFSIVKDDDGDLWIGGLEGNLLRMDSSGGHRQAFNINWIHAIEVIDNERVAVATVNGFYVVHKSTGEVRKFATSHDFHALNVSSYITCMCFNKDNTVWLGTEGGGLTLYNMLTHEVEVFTTANGMPSDDVYSLQRDSKGRIWVSTGQGLAIVEDSLITNLNYIYQIDKVYNKSSCTILSDGRFAYGSTSGAVLISPDALVELDYQSSLIFTDLQIDYLNTDEAKIMYPSIYAMLQRNHVQLSHENNSFTVFFEAVNYRYQHDIAYQYILEGYEKSWSSFSQDGYVHYKNVAPGDYTLKVRSLQQSSGKVISEKVLVVEISEPWWNSWYAWVAYVCLAALLFYFIFSYKSNQLQKKYDEDKIQFFINTAHDIRTPVTLIMAPLENLEKEKNLSGDARYFLELIHGNAHKLNSLISQLLEFEKVDTHQKKLDLNPVCLNEVVMEEGSCFQALCEKKQIKLTLSLPDENIYVMGDRHLMEVLLDNLLSNACKYTKPQGDICLSLFYKNRKAVIEVADNGIGIPMKAKKHLFSTVYRADNARESQEVGTGFGLLQVQRIIKMLHGKITYKSELLKGSTFTISFSKIVNMEGKTTALCDSSERQLPTALVSEMDKDFTQGEQIEGAEDQHTKNTVLIVEDNDALRGYLRRTFDQDYRVVDVPDGKKALEFLETGYPDIILSDVMMPGIQGDELCRLVKENPDTSGIPFVLLTAKVNHNAIVEGLKKGADDYIPKPFSTEILRVRVNGLIENRNRMRNFFMQQALKHVEGEEETRQDEDLPKNIQVTSGEGQEEGSDISSMLSESDHMFVLQATQIVVDNMSNMDFNINELCQEMAMSRTLFYSRLKSLTGKAPQEFIRIIRLQKAAELLKEGKNVSEVAGDTGFVNVKYFSMLFKKQFGIQPSKYDGRK